MSRQLYFPEKKLLGVCSWLASSTGVSVRKLRLAAVALTILPMGSDFLLLGGSLFFVYFVAAIAISFID